MSIFEDTNSRSLRSLLSEIDTRTTALPDFQRDFVWDPKQTQELIVSIASNYPAGSILRVRDAKKFFAARAVECAPPLNGARHTFLILDGQQRLTSLYQAFYGVGDHRYFLDLKKLMKGEDFEDAIFYARASSNLSRTYEGLEGQTKDLTLPLGVLKDGAGGYMTWIVSATNSMEPKARQKLIAALTKVHEEWIQTIDGYQFPVVTLSDKTAPDALCTIFETLNRTGVRLSVFELLTARFWPLKVNLRELLAEARKQHSIIKQFDLDPYYLLQAIALACRKVPSCKRGDILELTAKEMNAWWDDVVAAMAEALTILRDDCGVALPKWLPYNSIVAPMAAVIAKTGRMKSAKAGARREKLKRWFWCSVFGQTYESSANSQSAKDVAELETWLAGGDPPAAVENLRFDPKSLREIGPRQRSIYRGVISLILSNGARDFHTQSIITGRLIEDEEIDDHHIFPDAFLTSELKVRKAKLRECVLNRTLIDGTTNKAIGKRAPSDYMSKIRNTAGFPFEKILASHSIPSGKKSPLWTDSFDDFLEQRQSLLWEAIEQATGLTEASDLEVEADD